MEECGTCEGAERKRWRRCVMPLRTMLGFPEPIYEDSIEECSECNGTGTVEKDEDDEV